MMKFKIALISLLLMSCSSAKPPPTTTPVINVPTPVMVIDTSLANKESNLDYQVKLKLTSSVGGSAIEDKTLVKVRGFIERNETPELPVFGLVIFTNKPIDKEQEEKYKHICKVWESTFLIKKELINSLNIKTFTTYWPTINKNTGTCDDLNNYDYAYSEEIVTKLGIDKPGPVLVAVYNNNDKVKHIELYINSLDKKDIENVFNIWKYDLVVTNKGWNSTFKLANFKEKFKLILNIYGEQLLSFKEG